MKRYPIVVLAFATIGFGLLIRPTNADRPETLSTQTSKNYGHFQQATTPHGLPAQASDQPLAQDSTNMCIRVYTGTVRSVYAIANPGGVSGFNDYQLTNFSQRLLSQSATQMEVEVAIQYYVDTDTPYPVNPAALPSEAL